MNEPRITDAVRDLVRELGHGAGCCAIELLEEAIAARFGASNVRIAIQAAAFFGKIDVDEERRIVRVRRTAKEAQSA